MPRYRKLHTKTVESLDMNDMPDDFTRLLWVLLPLALCREGRGIDNPAWLKSKLFPLREDVNQEQVGTAFAWLVQRGMVEVYEVDGRGYFHVPTFHKYQGNTGKEAESDYPAPPSEVPTESVESKSGASPELVQSKSASDATTDATTTTDADATTTTDARERVANGAADDVGYSLLAEFGVDEPSLSQCAAYPVEYIRAYVDAARQKKSLTNPQGWVVARLQSGEPPPRARDPTADRRRFIVNDAVQR